MTKLLEEIDFDAWDKQLGIKQEPVKVDEDEYMKSQGYEKIQFPNGKPYYQKKF